MMHKRRIVDDERYVHLITFSVYRRRRLLDQDPPKRIVLGSLNEVLDQYSALCLCFVVMPDHLHALIWLPVTGQLSAFLHSWKLRSSLTLRDWFRQHTDEYFRQFGEGKRFWQPKYYAFEIYERLKLEEKLQYMHENPVRAGLVEKITDWKWGSACWYEWGRSVGVPIQWVE